MKRNRLYAIFCTLAVVAAGAAGCADDPTLGYATDGEATLSATVEFRPLAPALDQATRTAGDRIKSIESLCVLLYDADGNLIEKYPLTEGKGAGQYTLTDEERNPGDGYPDSDQPIAEQKTPRATFTLAGKVPYGDYYLYAVANMGDLSDHADKIRTVEGLRSIRLEWKTDVSQDNQMFGFFTSPDEILKEAPLLRINTPQTTLHAWLRRAASKVTIAYDGSELEEGVFVYLKSVRIIDIPKACALGDKNTPTDKNQLTDGETITYATGTNYDETWPARVTRGRPVYPYTGEYNEAKEPEYKARNHSETADALFFYENMQGQGKDKRQDAGPTPDAPGDGKLDYPGNKYEGDDGYKDNMPCGTYIEVKAFYRSINLDRLSCGDITYRFMLGKNVTTDYDAERNHHYKLTLKFKRFANDVDWHIDYSEEQPGLLIPSPFYISYLYNHSMLMPLKVNTGNYSIESLKAEIVENGWAPTGAPKYAYYSPADLPKEPDGKPFNGFLSLRQTVHTLIPGGGKDAQESEAVNKKYYYDNYRHKRNYLTAAGSHNIDAVDPDEKKALGNEGDGKYYVSVDEENKSTTFQIPLYTRAKQMIINTGFTGNNPFVAYRRTAKVQITAVLKDGEGHRKELKDIATIYQVRRVVNPKGIWRKHDTRTPFHVVLKQLPEESASQFRTFTSEGPWKAYVARGDKETIHLAQDTVRGETDTPIDFNIFFEGCNADESKFAIIRVEYHNNSCYHLIFARQGASSVALVPGGRRWRTCNMRTATTEASCPVEEGSLFRFGNWTDPIDATNNVADGFKDHAKTGLLIAGTANTRKTWSNIQSLAATKTFSNPTVDGKELEVAAFEDFEALYQSDDIEQGYGVLYGNDATETLTEVDEVYGHSYSTHGDANTEGKGYGMRGTFVYNKSEKTAYSGRHLFFPIGTSGYGRRKNSDAYVDGYATTGKNTAVVKYAGTARYIQEMYRPLFFDLFRRPGAIYWLQKRVEATGRESPNEQKAMGWDFNYYTFDFNLLSATNIIDDKDNKENSSDACFIRCVEKN